MADLNGILQAVYDSATGALRVETASVGGAGYTTQNITTTATTTITATYLRAITINTKSGAGGTIAVKDGTTVIGTIDATQLGTFTYDRAITTNITIVTATAAGDITVAFK